jgi:hypothetical protein
VHLFGRPLIALVDDLHRLLARGEREAEQAQVVLELRERGRARASAYSRMSVESISTSPSSHTSVGALTTGLISRNCAKVRKTDSDRCSKGSPRSCSEIATRRT